LDLATPAFLTPPPTACGGGSSSSNNSNSNNSNSSSNNNSSSNSSSSSSTSQDWIKKGALVNVLENTSPGYNIEPGLGKIWKIHRVSSVSDVVKFVDIKYILDNRMLKNVNVTG
jgi:hypothetical protein